MPRSFRLIYVTSLGHSGSTLLDLLISGHSRTVSVGEAMRFSPARELRMSCSCAAESVWRCPFWTRVDAGIAAEIGLRLDELDLCGGDAESFRRHNTAFYRAIAAVSGRQVIVDSSKDTRRLERLIAEGFDVLPIHLIRDAYGVVYSYARKGRGWVRASRRYRRQLSATLRLLRDTDHVRLRYEALARDPAAGLTALMPRLGLEFEPQQLDWAGRERHNCGGNRMRRAKDSAIRPDRAWETGLTGWQRALIRLLTAPALLRAARDD